MTAFQWPKGKRCAVSISFDDARPSQVLGGVPILDRYGFRGTFYVLMDKVRALEAEWRKALATGHEFGNHTHLHPCSGNFTWSRDKALEDYTLERMGEELRFASADIEKFTGSRPTSFAYCCGQKFVGRGTAARSYVPVVAEQFLVGRGFRDEYLNDPSYVDLAQVAGHDADCSTLEGLRTALEAAAKGGQWLALVIHDVDETKPQSIRPTVLDAFCREVQARGDVWVDTLSAVGSHIATARKAKITSAG